jgi:hypothetical protein
MPVTETMGMLIQEFLLLMCAAKQRLRVTCTAKNFISQPATVFADFLAIHGLVQVHNKHNYIIQAVGRVWKISEILNTLFIRSIILNTL